MIISGKLKDIETELHDMFNIYYDTFDEDNYDGVDNKHFKMQEIVSPCQI